MLIISLHPQVPNHSLRCAIAEFTTLWKTLIAEKSSDNPSSSCEAIEAEVRQDVERRMKEELDAARSAMKEELDMARHVMESEAAQKMAVEADAAAGGQLHSALSDDEAACDSDLKLMYAFDEEAADGYDLTDVPLQEHIARNTFIELPMPAVTPMRRTQSAPPICNTPTPIAAATAPDVAPSRANLEFTTTR